MNKDYPCRNCGYAFWQYLSMQRLCDQCRIKSLPKRKPIQKIGKVGKQWVKTRREWLAENPPDVHGRWVCYLVLSAGCYRTMTIETLNIDHEKSRARHPELRFVKSNLKPSCPPCNKLKGSRSIEEVRTNDGV